MLMKGAVPVWGLTTEAKFMMSVKRRRMRLPLHTLVKSSDPLTNWLRSRIGSPAGVSPILTSA